MQNGKRSYTQRLAVTHVMISGLDFNPEELISLDDWAIDCGIAVMDVIVSLEHLVKQGYIKIGWYHVETQEIKYPWIVAA